MTRSEEWQVIESENAVWDLLRYYRSIRGARVQEKFLSLLNDELCIEAGDKTIPVKREVVDLLFSYLDIEESLLETAFSNLRTEDESKEFCDTNNFSYSVTETANKDHHQSSKTLIAAVSEIAEEICSIHSLTLEKDPQKRCIWLNNEELGVTSRNLDGAVPGLVNPFALWEIKEYWGKTQGGSKMSDAVYECQLVGKEIREYEKRLSVRINHIVFLDGKDQWKHRVSDLRRFIDLTYQGLIDHLIIGKEVETSWRATLESIILEQ